MKGGGHSYGAYGLAGALVINLSQFQDVTLDTTTNIATVGGGARLGNMATKIFNLNKRAYVPLLSLCMINTNTLPVPVCRTGPVPASASADTARSAASATTAASGGSSSTASSSSTWSSRTAPAHPSQQRSTRICSGRSAEPGRASPSSPASTSRRSPRRRPTSTTRTPTSTPPRLQPPRGSSTPRTGRNRTRRRSSASGSSCRRATRSSCRVYTQEVWRHSTPYSHRSSQA